MSARGRAAITKPGGRTVEVDAASGWTLMEAQDYAARYHSPGCVATGVLPLSVDVDAALRASCEGVAGITPVFRSLLSPEDLKDIEAGDIPVMPTLRGYVRSFAEGIRSGRLARAKPVRCCDCPNFVGDTIGDGVGVGQCRVDGEGAQPRGRHEVRPALWARADRACKDHRPHL